MDAYMLLRTLGALGIVLGLLGGALWMVRRYNIRLPGRVGAGGATRRLELVERAALDSRRSVALLRRDGREHLILLAPEGNVMLETAIIRDAIDREAEAARVEAEREAAEIAKAEAEAMRESFYAMVDKARDGVKEKVATVAEAVGTAKASAGEAVRRAQPVLEQVKARLAARPAPAAPEPALPAPQPVKAAPQRKSRQSGNGKRRAQSNARG